MIRDQRNRALAAEIDIGLIDQHRDVGMIFEQPGDLHARKGDSGRRVGISDHDRPRLAPIILDPYAHCAIKRHGLAGEPEQLRPHGIKAVGDVRKHAEEPVVCMTLRRSKGGSNSRSRHGPP